MNPAPTTCPPELLAKESRLKDLIAGYGSLAVAYSGGVDSTFLSDVAHDVLADKARILIGDSPSIPRSELAEATALARERGWNLEIVHTEEFDNDAYVANDGTRCYHCRAELFTKMSEYAEANGIEHERYLISQELALHLQVRQLPSIAIIDDQGRLAVGRVVQSVRQLHDTFQRADADRPRQPEQ